MWLSEVENMKKSKNNVKLVKFLHLVVRYMFSEDFFSCSSYNPEQKLHETWENAVETRGSHGDAACKLRWPRMDGTFFVMWSSEWLGIWSFQSWSFCHGPRIFSSDTSWCDAKFLEWDKIGLFSAAWLFQWSVHVYILYIRKRCEILRSFPEILGDPKRMEQKSRCPLESMFKTSGLPWIGHFGYCRDVSKVGLMRERFLWSFRESSP